MLADDDSHEGHSHATLNPDADKRPLSMALGLVGIAVNLEATGQVSRANRASLNVDGSFQHILSDLIAFVAAAIAAGVILATGFSRADGVAALLVAAIMIRASYRLLRDSGR